MTLEKKFDEIIDSEIPHTSFLSEKSVKVCMKESYNLAIEDVLNWLSEQSHLSDNVNYLKEEYINKFLDK